MQNRENLEKKHNSGSGWFKTIAVLSLINIIIVFADWNLMFPVGLGTSLFAAALFNYPPDQHPYVDAVRFIGLVFLLLSLVIIGLLFFFATKARKGKYWAYVTDMIIHLCDAFLCAWIKDWISVAFHAWGLFSIWGGFSALRVLKTLDSQG